MSDATCPACGWQIGDGYPCEHVNRLLDAIEGIEHPPLPPLNEDPVAIRLGLVQPGTAMDANHISIPDGPS